MARILGFRKRPAPALGLTTLFLVSPCLKWRWCKLSPGGFKGQVREGVSSAGLPVCGSLITVFVFALIIWILT